MSLPAEFARELAAFPAALQRLIEAELAAGNSIEEVGHSHPAPPAGAYVKLRERITTRPRASGDGLDFRARDSSISAGEFTDAERFYFVLEPPGPPPSESDMDAIRRGLQPNVDPLEAVALRRTGSSVEIVLGRSFSTPTSSMPWSPKAVSCVETPTGCRHELHFRDKRPPHEVQFALERELMVLFEIVGVGADLVPAVPPVDDGLRLRARANVTGALYDFELRFVAAEEADNRYSLRTEASWAHQPAAHHGYYRKAADGWLQLWTRDLVPADPTDAREGSRERYVQLREGALRAESHLDSVAAIQRAILDGLLRGGRYASAHKEGGTNITWHRDRFVRSDYGEDPHLREYVDESEFLAMLRQFCHGDVSSRATTNPLPERDAWRLILRRMTPG